MLHNNLLSILVSLVFAIASGRRTIETFHIRSENDEGKVLCGNTFLAEFQFLCLEIRWQYYSRKLMYKGLIFFYCFQHWQVTLDTMILFWPKIITIDLTMIAMLIFQHVISMIHPDYQTNRIYINLILLFAK